MRIAPAYRMRISTKERIFIVYKISGYARNAIEVIRVGKAYTRHEDYSKSILKAYEKYNIDRGGDKTKTEAILVDDFDEFCVRIHIEQQMRKIKNKPYTIPLRARELCENYFNQRHNKK